MMQLIKSVSELRSVRSKLAGTVGFVPTMGYLHEGHLSLVRRAAEECDHVIVSIYVNPTQFGPSEDFEAYPRDLERDMSLLEPLGVDIVFAPTDDEMYPPGFQTYVEVTELTKVLEGASRQGHFRGVTTVVAKLFNMVQPDKAYFGQKDAQQAIVIRRMVADLNFPLEIVVCPTVREPDGLAMSSRNTYLTPEQREAAPDKARALSAAEKAYMDGERSSGRLREIMLDVLNSEPLAEVEYVSVADNETLQELDGPIEKPVLLSMAVRIGKTRLIDNIVLGGTDRG